MKIKLLSEARGDFLGRMKNSHGGTLISFVAIDKYCGDCCAIYR